MENTYPFIDSNNQSLNDSASTTSHQMNSSYSNVDIIYSSDKYYMPVICHTIFEINIQHNLINFFYKKGTASLIEDVDKQLMVILRDGKTLIGYLRSIDQYANLLLSNTMERVVVGNKYGEAERGIYIIRGENVVLIGEVDTNQASIESRAARHGLAGKQVEMIKVPFEEILELKKAVEEKEKEAEKNKKNALLDRCLIPQCDSILDDYY
jgi:U6 snRNA-associated Sm-like protein LSm1